MGFVRWSLMGLVAGIALAGCGDFWQAPSSSSSTTTTTTLSSGYFYLIDQATSQIVSFYISSGTLEEVGAYAVPEPPVALTVAPNNDFLYVSTAYGIYAYTLSSGVPTIENSSQVIVSDPAAAMAIDSTSSWLIESSGTGTLNAVPIVTSTGLVDTSASNCTSSSVICQVALSGSAIHQIAISPNNDYVFVAAGTTGTQAYGFKAANANPFGSAAYKTIAPENSSAGAALAVAVDTSTRLLYIGEAAAYESSTGGLRVFTIGSGGALTELSGSPYSSGGTGPHAILPKSTGDYVYVANWVGTSSGKIAGFAISDSSGTYSLTSTSTTASTVVEPVGLIEDSNNNFVIAVGSVSTPYLDAYVFDTTTPSELDLTLYSSSAAAVGIAANYP